MHFQTLFRKFIDLQCEWNLFWSRKNERIHSLDAFWLKINSFQIACYCDISLNCPFFVFFDNFKIFFDFQSQWNVFKCMLIKQIQSFNVFQLKYWLFSNFVSLWRFWQIMLYRRKNNVSQVKPLFPIVKFTQL